MSYNAITQRLETLQQHYAAYRLTEGKRVCIWRLRADEYRMAEAFYYYEQSEGARFPDLFLGLAPAFQNPTQYVQALLDEFRLMLDTQSGELATHGVNLPFHLPTTIRDSARLWQYFSQLVEALHYLEGDLVLWLNPVQIEDQPAWEEWLIQALEAPLPARVHWLLTPMIDTAPLPLLEERHQDIGYAITPDLDMESAIRQMASGGNPQEPDSQYRQAIVAMNLAAQKGHTPKAKKQAQRALAIAQQQAGWEHLEVAAHLALAAFLPASEQAFAQDQYERALSIAHRAYEEEHPAGKAVYLQALMAQAAFDFRSRRFLEAAAQYEKVPPLTEGEPDYVFQRMEAQRMAGYCYRQARELHKAWDAYWAALESAELLDEATRRNSTLPYIGQGLLEISLPTHHQREEVYIRQKIEAYVGADWEARIRNPQTTAP